MRNWCLRKVVEGGGNESKGEGGLRDSRWHTVSPVETENGPSSPATDPVLCPRLMDWLAHESLILEGWTLDLEVGTHNVGWPSQNRSP